MKIKALTVRAPWAHFIATGRKPIELRTKPTNYRGPLLITAGLKHSTSSALVTSDELEAGLDAPRGVACCIVDVVDCRPATPDDAHDACSEPEPGEFAWVLSNPRPVPPVPVSGKLGFFYVELPCPLCGDEPTKREGVACYHCAQPSEIG